jgi:hypothetical protein
MFSDTYNSLKPEEEKLMTEFFEEMFNAADKLSGV